MDSILILAIAICVLALAVVLGVFGYCFLQFQKEIFTQNNINARAVRREIQTDTGSAQSDDSDLTSLLLPVLMSAQANGGNINIEKVLTENPQLAQKLMGAFSGGK